MKPECKIFRFIMADTYYKRVKSRNSEKYKSLSESNTTSRSSSSSGPATASGSTSSVVTGPSTPGPTAVVTGTPGPTAPGPTAPLPSGPVPPVALTDPPEIVELKRKVEEANANVVKFTEKYNIKKLEIRKAIEDKTALTNERDLPTTTASRKDALKLEIVQITGIFKQKQGERNLAAVEKANAEKLAKLATANLMFAVKKAGLVKGGTRRKRSNATIGTRKMKFIY
jgi:hypothetical protein